MMINRLRIICVALVFILSHSVLSAQEELPRGVIVSKNEFKQAVTIRNQETGKRHTYFLNEKTRISSGETPFKFEDIQPGQAVVLNFLRTDFGREIEFMRIPDVDEIVELDPIDSNLDFFISGVVTGVRPLKRTITIRGPQTSARLTLHVPESVVIMQDATPVKLRTIKAGDQIEFKYHETAQGYLILSGNFVRPAMQK